MYTCTLNFSSFYSFLPAVSFPPFLVSCSPWRCSCVWGLFPQRGKKEGKEGRRGKLRKKKENTSDTTRQIRVNDCSDAVFSSNVLFWNQSLSFLFLLPFHSIIQLSSCIRFLIWFDWMEMENTSCVLSLPLHWKRKVERKHATVKRKGRRKKRRKKN